MRFLGLDIGTTRMKCGVYNQAGEPEYFDRVDYGEMRRGKESYIDIDQILSCALALLKKAFGTCPFDSIAVSSLGESFVLLDEEDRPVFYPMLYIDPRGKDEAEEQMKHAEDIFRISGVYPQGMYSVYKLMWIKRHAPKAYEKA